MKKTLYELVGVPPDTPTAVIGMAIKRRLQKLKDAGTPDAQAEVYALKECWAVLGNDKKRKAYDAKLMAAAVALPTPRAPSAPAAAPVASTLAGDETDPFPWKDWAGVAALVLVLGGFSGYRGYRAESDRMLKDQVDAAIAKGPAIWKRPVPKT